MNNISPNSSIAGYLTPNNLPITDDALDHFFHDLFCNVLNLDPTLCRPRWQVEPTNMPNNSTTWIAQGIEEFPTDVNQSQTFINGTGMVVNAYQELDNLISIYGPMMQLFELKLRMGLALDQNREYMNSQGIVLVKVHKARNVSLLINQQWQKKIDLKITFRRQLSIIYDVLNILEAPVSVHTNSGYTTSVIAG